MQNVISCIGHNNQVEHHDQKKENSTHFKFFHNSLLLTCLHVHACYMSTRSGTRCFTNSKKYTFVQEIGLKLICFWGKWTKNVINQFQTCHRRKFWRFPVHWLEGESTTHTDCRGVFIRQWWCHASGFRGKSDLPPDVLNIEKRTQHSQACQLILRIAESSLFLRIQNQNSTMKVEISSVVTATRWSHVSSYWDKTSIK